MHAGVCEDDAGLIDRAVDLLERPGQRRTASGAPARALLESHCGPKPTLDAIESIYGGMLPPEEATDPVRPHPCW